MVVTIRAAASAVAIGTSVENAGMRSRPFEWYEPAAPTAMTNMVTEKMTIDSTFFLSVTNKTVRTPNTTTASDVMR